MALVRCEAHGKPRGRTQSYIRQVNPVGYPETAAICGRKGCENAGRVWLSEQEVRDCDAGTRVFAVPNAAVSIKVE